MLGILLLYFIGRPFYRLAELHKRKKWGFSLLGVGAYFAGQILFALVILIGMELFGWEMFGDVEDPAIDILSIPFGLLAAWGVYQLLKKNWESKTSNLEESEILDQMEP